MDCITMLAQAVETAQQASQPPEQHVVPINWIWQQITSLSVLEALTFISFGAVCLFYGWRVFKILVIISFSFFGLLLGVAISDKISTENNHLWGGLIGMVLTAFLSLPLMRWAVSILGAAAGGVLTSGLWYGCGLSEQYLWAGALIGLIAGAMISFIIFKIAVMLFSSLTGGILVTVGALALLYLYPRTSKELEILLFTEKWFLPVALLIPTVLGVMIQHKFIKGSQDWKI